MPSTKMYHNKRLIRIVVPHLVYDKIKLKGNNFGWVTCMQQPFHRYTIYGGYPSNINNFFCKGHPQRSIVSIKQNKFSYATTLT